MAMAATTVAVAVIMLTSKVVVAFTRVQDLHLDEVEKETHDSDN